MEELKKESAKRIGKTRSEEKRRVSFSNEWKTYFYLNGIRYRAKIILFDEQPSASESRR